mgnify:CR=1 FL=1
MKLVIIDGQGGKMGRAVIEQLKKNLPYLEIYAIGTNSIATSAMLKAGADYGATGENPVIVGARTADIIIGPIGIVIADNGIGFKISGEDAIKPFVTTKTNGLGLGLNIC